MVFASVQTLHPPRRVDRDQDLLSVWSNPLLHSADRFRLDIKPGKALKSEVLKTCRSGQFRPGLTMDYSQFFQNALNRLHDERRYRVFADLERIAGRFPHAIWHSPKGQRNVVIW